MQSPTSDINPTSNLIQRRYTNWCTLTLKVHLISIRARQVTNNILNIDFCICGILSRLVRSFHLFTVMLLIYSNSALTRFTSCSVNMGFLMKQPMLFSVCTSLAASIFISPEVMKHTLALMSFCNNL
jgi:hypothetical protein